MNLELFDTSTLCGTQALGAEAFVLRGRALSQIETIWESLDAIQKRSPFRSMKTPGGHTMSVSTTSCGNLGWVSDAKGYRYSEYDPVTNKPWPDLPDSFLKLAQEAAAEVGLGPFTPDSCLINRYHPGSRMSLHQDRNEKNLSAPIVSVSLGLPAMFLFAGFRRADKAQRVPLFHGDVVVWGGVDRMRFHGILPLKPGDHPLLGSQRINLTFRKAGY